MQYRLYPHLNNVHLYSSSQFDIKAASGNLSAVTSVVFWDGPSLVFGDYLDPIFELSNITRSDTDQVVIDRADGDTFIPPQYQTSQRFSGSFRKGFGFQIHPGITLTSIMYASSKKQFYKCIYI